MSRSCALFSLFHPNLQSGCAQRTHFASRLQVTRCKRASCDRCSRDARLGRSTILYPPSLYRRPLSSTATSGHVNTYVSLTYLKRSVNLILGSNLPTKKFHMRLSLCRTNRLCRLNTASALSKCQQYHDRLFASLPQWMLHERVQNAVLK